MYDGIDLRKYEELSDRLSLSSRKCSDGLCCFLTLDFSRHISVHRKYFMGYYTLRKDGRVYEAKRFACQNLDVSLIDNEVRFSCKEYDSKYRPEFCEKWPEGGLIVHKKGIWREKELILPQTCTAEGLRRRRDKRIAVYSFYLFNKEKYPEFEEFAICSDNGHLLVPVPRLRR